VTRSLVETDNPFSENALKEIFKVKAGKPSVIVSRENRLEFRPDIVNAFLDQEDVPDAAEYISAICYQTTSLLPVYYFMIQGRLSVEDVIALIDSSKSTSQARAKLRDRMSMSTTKGDRQEPARPSNPTIGDYHRRVLEKALPDYPEMGVLKHILNAVLTLGSAEIDVPYLFPRLKTWFENSYSDMDGNAKGLFRRVLVHLDTVLYAPKADELCGIHGEYDG